MLARRTTPAALHIYTTAPPRWCLRWKPGHGNPVVQDFCHSGVHRQFSSENHLLDVKLVRVHAAVGRYNVWDEGHAHATTAGEDGVVLRTAATAFAIDTTAHHTQHAFHKPRITLVCQRCNTHHILLRKNKGFPC